jgi:hypothetical protein
MLYLLKALVVDQPLFDRGVQACQYRWGGGGNSAALVVTNHSADKAILNIGGFDTGLIEILHKSADVA